MFLAGMGLGGAALGFDLTPEVVASDRALWPRSVLVSIPLEAPVMIQGRESGRINLPAGREYPLQAVGGGEVTIDAGGSSQRVAISDTDLMERAAAQRVALDQRRAAAAARMAAGMPAVAAGATPAPLAAPSKPHALGGLFRKLVAVNGRRVSSYDPARLAGKEYIAVYYSASWCGPCRQFTPKLVEWYRKNEGKRDRFEVLFVSSDRSEKQMEEYMVEDGMPWPAVPFGDLKASNPIEVNRGRGIPCLVLFDADGQPVAHSYVDGRYLGPSVVLQKLETLLGGTD